MTQIKASARSIPAETGASRLLRVFSGRRGRHLREYLTGYLMILPAVALIFMFGIFPVGFALYVSLHKWRLKRGDFIGLANYTRAVDNLAYVFFFALAIGALIGVWVFLRRIRKQAEENHDRPWLLALPAALYAAAVMSFLRWIILLLPQVLDIADKIKGLERTQQLFLQFLGEAFRAESVMPAFWLSLGLFLTSIFVGFLTARLGRNPRRLSYQAQFSIMWLSGVIGLLLLWFTYGQATEAYRVALESGTDPGIWPQVITIGSGVLLLVLAWFVWRSAEGQTSNRAFLIRILGALVLLVGGWLLIGELPAVIAAGDEDMWSGLKVTIFYSLGTVPFELAISMFLAILLFQKLAGSELFRMLYFLPYVTPFVASATVFRQMFSVRPQAPVNRVLNFLGLETLQWIQEPKGIFQLLGDSAGIDIPSWAVGPSLALVVIMIYSIWVFVGYNTVIYLAGLGNISTELIEAAEIDGAGRWEIFRHIIFPLLSPTTYFLSLMAIIGTFKAFAHIYVMRHEFALNTVDTFSVTIFLEFFDKTRFGYASALAFVLFAIILALTVINNRIQGTRVFYG
ncbi:MAG TPA: sugar ABC transporter permease [Anaerolineae bacterium]|nr:sugar ABC transporter permease [Anaerolineae bacterium]